MSTAAQLRAVTASDHCRIPVLGIGPHLADDSGASSPLARPIARTFEDTGFFVIADHGVSPRLAENTFAVAAQFFTRPETDKLALKTGKYNIGYRPIRGQVVWHPPVNKNTQPNFCETFYITRDRVPRPPGHRQQQAARRATGGRGTCPNSGRRRTASSTATAPCDTRSRSFSSRTTIRSWTASRLSVGPDNPRRYEPTTYGAFSQRLLTLNFAHRRADGSGEYTYEGAVDRSAGFRTGHPFQVAGWRRRMKEDHIGRSVRRLEDRRFLIGQGRYVDDIDMPGQLHGIVLRSPYGHAAIEGIDTAAARAMPGVNGVFTAADLDADGIGKLPCIAQVATVAPIIVPPRWALTRDRVRHVGDPVAFVVADTGDQARDAAELVEVIYRQLPAVVGAMEALAVEAPQLWDEAPGNLCYRFERGDKRRSKQRSPRQPISSRSSWSTTGWSLPRSSRAPQSAITMLPPIGSNCC